MKNWTLKVTLFLLPLMAMLAFPAIAQDKAIDST
jgi:hypothetical protein